MLEMVKGKAVRVWLARWLLRRAGGGLGAFRVQEGRKRRHRLVLPCCRGMVPARLHAHFYFFFVPVSSPHVHLSMLVRQISELTSFLNTRGVPYEVREWKVGDYGWVVQPDAGRRPTAGEVSLVRSCRLR